LARRVAARAAASTSSAKSIVPTTSERLAGSATNGVATGLRSAQPYSAPDDAPVRRTHQSKPPCSSIHSTWSARSRSVATAGVLYVWSLRELSSAVASDRNSGIQRSVPASSSMRASAAGLRNASHRPPSEAKHFCGAK
jgi:hypothetical protein